MMNTNHWLILVLLVALSGCSAFSQATPAAIPTVVLDPGGGAGATPQVARPASSAGVVASGVVAPAEEASLVFTLAGKVEAVEVAVGQPVREATCWCA